VIKYYDLNKIMSDNDNYKILNSYILICIIKSVHTAFTNFSNKITKLPKYFKKNDCY